MRIISFNLLLVMKDAYAGVSFPPSFSSFSHPILSVLSFFLKFDNKNQILEILFFSEFYLIGLPASACHP